MTTTGNGARNFPSAPSTDERTALKAGTSTAFSPAMTVTAAAFFHQIDFPIIFGRLPG